MAELSQEGSFSLDDFERSIVENAAALPNVDNLTTCNCRGYCLREKGRNFCPCKSINSFCSEACHGDGFSCCMNNRRVQESDSDDTDSDLYMQEDEREGNGSEEENKSEEDNESEEETESEKELEMQENRKRKKGQTRGRGRGRARGRGRVADQGIGQQGGRGQRGCGRGSRGRGRSRGRGGRGRLIEQPNAAEILANHEQELDDLIEAMDFVSLKDFAKALLRRQPGAYADVVNGELPGANQPPPPSPEPENPAPAWCNCGHCVVMPTQEENKCCSERPGRSCISRSNLFRQVILDGNVLDLAMRYREDMLVLNEVRNNENFRHAAYRQFVLWQYGKLGRGNRRVVPSCCVTTIRASYPSPNGIYTGYRPSRL